jgi:hypothetical protein
MAANGTPAANSAAPARCNMSRLSIGSSSSKT